MDSFALTVVFLVGGLKDRLCCRDSRIERGPATVQVLLALLNVPLVLAHAHVWSLHPGRRTA